MLLPILEVNLCPTPQVLKTEEFSSHIWSYHIIIFFSFLVAGFGLVIFLYQVKTTYFKNSFAKLNYDFTWSLFHEKEKRQNHSYFQF